MNQDTIEQYNKLIRQIQAGVCLCENDRQWLAAHPIESVRYGEPWILCDMIPLDPGKEYALVIQCQTAMEAHPIVPTLTIPFEKDGFIRLAGVVGAQINTKGMKKSTKLSFRMLPGITSTARCVSAAGLLMISYQGWVPDHKPIPLWFESVSCDRFAMRKTVHSDNMMEYSCRAADGTEDAFRFLINWYTV